MDKIKVEICCGTACYLLGAAKMMDLEGDVPAACRDRVEIEAKTCLELCERDQLGGAPYGGHRPGDAREGSRPPRGTVRRTELSLC